MLKQQSVMGNPFEFREVMKAAFGFTDKTVDEVLADQKRRHDEENRKPARKSPSRAPTLQAVPKQTEIEKLNVLLAQGKPTESPTAE